MGTRSLTVFVDTWQETNRPLQEMLVLVITGFIKPTVKLVLAKRVDKAIPV